MKSFSSVCRLFGTCLVCVIFNISVLQAQTPSWEWVANPSARANDAALGITADKEGNTYTVGTTTSSFVSNAFGTIYPMIVGNDTLGQVFQGGSSAFIVKYDKAGNPVWGRGAPGKGRVAYHLVALDPDGNIYAVGISNADSIQVGDEWVVRGSQQENALLIVKYKPDGDVINVQKYYADKEVLPRGLALEKDGSLYLTGTTRATSIDFGNGVSVPGPNNVWYDPFVVKFDKTGTALWARTIKGGPSRDRATTIATDQQGGVYVGGNINSTDTVYFDENTKLRNQDAKYGYLVKYDAADGKLLWMKTLMPEGKLKGNKDASVVVDIKVDQAAGVHVLGYFEADSVDAGGSFVQQSKVAKKHAGTASMFVAKYDAAGQLSWIKKPFEGLAYIEKSNNGNDGEDGRLALDAAGNIYISTPFADTLHFGNIPLNSDYMKNYVDGLVAKYDKNLELQWANVVGGRYRNIMKGVALDNNKGVYVAITTQIAGSTTGKNDSIFFGEDFSLPPVGGFDFSIAKVLGGGSVGGDDGTSVQEVGFYGGVLIYPNPSGGIFQVESPTADLRSVSVYNLNGRLVRHSTVTSNHAAIDLRGQAQGVYFVKVSTDQGEAIARVVLRY